MKGSLPIFGILLAACAGSGPEISGDFGSVPAPSLEQIAEVGLKAGDTVVARKLQQETDTVYAVLIDYSVRPVPEDSIAWIRIRARTAAEEAISQPASLSEAEKDALKVGGVHLTAWLLVAAPLLLLLLLAGML